MNWKDLLFSNTCVVRFVMGNVVVNQTAQFVEKHEALVINLFVYSVNVWLCFGSQVLLWFNSNKPIYYYITYDCFLVRQA
jgi:hypothetical protein